MKVVVTEERDRFHVFTNNLVWTIRKTFGPVGQRGPCYISDIRQRYKPYDMLVHENYGPSSINHPSRGGAFGFGMIASRTQPEPGTPDTFWKNAWDLTSRRNGEFGYGMQVMDYNQISAGHFTFRAAFYVGGAQVMTVRWAYSFGFNDNVTCWLTLVPSLHSAVQWIKEPKIVVNGLVGFRGLKFKDTFGNYATQDLNKLGAPGKHTLQLPRKSAHTCIFAQNEWVAEIKSGNHLDAWAARADTQNPMSNMCITRVGEFAQSPGYCCPGGHLLRQTEVARDPGSGDIACMFHSWEGGYGAPDCWNTFRPWPTTNVAQMMSLRFRRP